MSIHVRKVASGLRNLADEIAMHDRLVDTVQWYQREREPDGTAYHPVPIVPMAIHDALCTSLAVVVHDEQAELVVCDRCQLAVENGAA